MIIVHDSEIKRTPSSIGMWIGLITAFSVLPTGIVFLIMSDEQRGYPLLICGIVFAIIGYKYVLKLIMNPPLYFGANRSGISFDTAKGRIVVPWDKVVGFSEGEIDRTPMDKNSLRGRPLYQPAVRIDFDETIAVQGRGWTHDISTTKNAIIVFPGLLGGSLSVSDVINLLERMKKKYS